MSRLTGNEVANLMEAYNAVYASQELSEEQIQEDFENWVNSLVEEGYDLSEYTWEDMYEVYLNEAGNPGGSLGQAQRLSQSAQNYARSSSGGTLGAGGGQAAMRALQAKGVDPRSAYARVYTQGQKNIEQAGRQPAQSTGMYGRYAPPSMQQRTPTPTSPTKPGRTFLDGSRPSTAPARPQRPTAPPTSSNAPAPARPATPSYAGATGVKPVGTPLPTNAVQPVAGAPAQNATFSAPAARPSLASQTAELRKMRMASQMRQAGANVTSTQLASFDMFDVVKGHLIDEGYADTEEAALQIMANMSEEWRDSIVEEVLDEATIRSVTSSQGKIKYKSPKYSPDEIENIKKTAHRQRRLKQRHRAGESEERSGQRSAEWEHQQDELRRKHPSRAMNAKIDSEGEPYYKEVPTDWHARKRRASGR